MAHRWTAFSVSYFFSFCLSTVALGADPAPSRVHEIVICKSPAKEAADSVNTASKASSSGRAVRTLRIYETKEKTETGESADGCRATYTKSNLEQTVGTSRQLQQCRSILSGIQKNLESSSWSCRRAGPMAVLRSSAAEASEALIDARAPLKEESIVR
jgi:hypothetical protein